MMVQPRPFKEQLEDAIEYTRKAFEEKAGLPCGGIEIRVHPSLYDDVVAATEGMSGVSVTAHEDMALIVGDTPNGRRFGIVEGRA